MVEVRILAEQNSIFQQFIAELRDQKTQKDSLRFRKNLERIGELFAYEISKELSYTDYDLQTPLGIAKAKRPEQVVLANVLRAGLPLHQGLLNYYDRAENAFVSASREMLKEGVLEVKVKYMAAPSLEGKVVILADPMLATGSSMLLAKEALLKQGIPKHWHIVAVIASQVAVDYLLECLKSTSATLWIGVVDPVLNDKSYIIPGLGDAGDLAFGEKL